MKAFAIVRMVGGHPDIDSEAYPYHGYTLCGHAGGWGAYLFSGTPAQLQVLNGLPDVYCICAVTEDGEVKWAELDGVIAPAVRDKLNTWLAAREWPTIPEGWTYRQVVLAAYRKFTENFELELNDICDSG